MACLLGETGCDPQNWHEKYVRMRRYLDDQAAERDAI